MTEPVMSSSGIRCLRSQSCPVAQVWTIICLLWVTQERVPCI